MLKTSSDGENEAPFVLRHADLSDPQTLELIALHLRGMNDTAPPENVFSLDAAGLSQPGITTWSVWSGSAICGIGALSQLDHATGEVKSMRTHPHFLRRGIGALILDAIIAEARHRGLTRLSLETGFGPSFEAALAMYRRRGFDNGDAFGEYEHTAYNQFLHLDLQ